MLPLWVLIPVGVGGALLVAWALFWDRARGRARCPKCWYDRGGLAIGVACPECGRTPRDAGEVHRTRRRRRVAVLGVVLAMAPAWNFAYSQCLRVYYRYKPKYAVAERIEVGGLTVEHYEWVADWVDYWEPPYLVVRDGSTTLVRLQGHRVGIGGSGDAGRVGLGEDITGDGEPNLILSTHSGGMRCCQAHYVFTIDRGNLVPMGVINRSSHWLDVEGDGVLEHLLYDDAYAYRWTSGAGSPYPVVLLRWDGVRYSAAVEAMRLPPPSEGEFTEMVEALPTPTLDDWEGLSPLLHRFFDLVYSGNAPLAWRLLEDRYPAPGLRSAKDAVRRELASGLRSSRYFHDLVALNAPADILDGEGDEPAGPGSGGGDNRP